MQSAKTFDFIIIGTGTAGLNCALTLSPFGKVLIVTKGKLKNSSTYLAQGGIAAVLKKEDSLSSHQKDTAAIDLIVKDNRCFGLQVLKNDTIQNLFARAVILATGGVGQLYQWTTNPSVIIGDGIAIAYRAGAKMQDLEFIQFHPTALAENASPLLLLSEALRGEGAKLLNAKNERFMQNYHPKKELAPRDVVSRAIFEEQQKGTV